MGLKQTFLNVFLTGFTAVFMNGTATAQDLNYQQLFTDATFGRAIDVSLPVGVIEGEHDVRNYWNDEKVAPPVVENKDDFLALHFQSISIR